MYTTLPKCKAQFLDSQVTVLHSYVSEAMGTPARKDDPEVVKACISLQSVKTSGGFLVDVTGFGITDTACLFLSQHAVYADHSSGHRPMVIVVPNGALGAAGEWKTVAMEQP